MRSKYLGVAAGTIAGLLVGVSLDGWSTPSRGAQSPGLVVKAKETDPRLVTLSPELEERARLKTQTVSQQTLKPTLRLVGSVNFDADEVADVGARIEGRVARMFVSTGDVVKVGQPLVEIESNELGGALADLLTARANLIAAEHNERRESDLAKQQLANAAVVERARAEVKALRAEVQGTMQRLLAMGFTPDELTRMEQGTGKSHVTLRSPIEGEVIARYTRLGQVVDPTQPILRVADLDHLWVELDVFERDLAHVKDGDSAEISSESHPGHTFRGRVTYVDATVDLATRTARVRVEVENPERLLRPGQFVHARLSTAGETRPVLSVPRTAVLQVEGVPSVFIALGNSKYMARPVELGASAGDWVEITRGLVEGDQAITEGAFVLKSELLR